MADKYIPTTTHGPWASGRPHLILSGPAGHREFALDRDLVRIGSSGDAECRLGGLQAVHAEIHHDANDEYVLVLYGPAVTNHLAEPIASIGGKLGEILRSGARFVLGEHAFVFERDEYADHGLPYGGRQGGEGSRERLQPDRPDYTGAHPVIPPAAGTEG